MMDYPYYYEADELKPLIEDGQAELLGMIDGAYQIYRVRSRIYREISVHNTPHYRFYLTEKWYGEILIKEIAEKEAKKNELR
jgi:hypothetical protein